MTTKLHSFHVKESVSESESFERSKSENFGIQESESDILPPTPQPWL